MKQRPNIDQLPSGKYRVRVGGRSGTRTRLRDAEKLREELTVAKETGRLDKVDADLQTLSDLAAEHMKAKRPDLAAATYRNYRTFWRSHVHPHPIASEPLRAITPEVVEDFRDDLRASDVGEQSIRQTLVLMQAVLERAVRFGRITTNPVKPVTKPKAKRKSKPRAIAPAEVERIRSKLRGADAVFVSVLAYAGLRPGEARALQWADVGPRLLAVERAVDDDGKLKPTKTEHERDVRLLTPLAADLAAWRKLSGNPADTTLIFPRADGGAWTDTDYRNWRRRRFTEAAAAAKVTIARPYDLRHAAASLWLHEGVNPVQVAKWMGHAPSMLLGTYAHVIEGLAPEDRRPAAEVIEEARRDNLMTSSSVQRGQPQSNGRSTATPAKPHGKRISGSLRKRPGRPAKTP